MTDDDIREAETAKTKKGALAVAAASWFRYAYLAFASQPKPDRHLFRLVRRNRVLRIVEVGIGDLQRSTALIEVAQRFAEGKKVSYTGMDRFEDRPSGHPALSLKEAHQRLHATGAQSRLVPGMAARSLASAANNCPNTDLLLFSSRLTDDELAGGWFYLPRMLRENSLVFRQQVGAEAGPQWVPLSTIEIAERADREFADISRNGGRRAA